MLHACPRAFFLWGAEAASCQRKAATRARWQAAEAEGQQELPEEGLMDKQERLARRRSSKKSEREADAKREADIKRARRDTTDIKMEL